MIQPSEKGQPKGQPDENLSGQFSLEELKSRKVALIFLKQEKFAALADPSILIAFSFMDIGRGMLDPELIIVERSKEDTNESEYTKEEWDCVNPSLKPDNVFPTLSATTSQQVEQISSEMGIEKESIVEAGIVTKALLDNFKGDKPIYVQFGKNEEGLRLMGRFIAGFKDGKLIIGPKFGHTLEWYSDLFDPDINQKVRSLLVHVDLKEANFEDLFPLVLFFVSQFKEVQVTQSLSEDRNEEIPAEIESKSSSEQ